MRLSKDFSCGAFSVYAPFSFIYFMSLCLVAGFAVAFSIQLNGCVQDRELASVVSVCGNSICEEGENPQNCQFDCPLGVCGNNYCDYDEKPSSCPEDCEWALCGDGACEGYENAFNCPGDCPLALCGNGVCEGGEEVSCPEDCFPRRCGNGICETNETWRNCPNDCVQTNKLDLLFVVDNSGSMLQTQEKLALAVDEIVEVLSGSGAGGLPDLHVGVVTTDLGAGSYGEIRYCDDSGGDRGVLGKSGELNLAGTCLNEGRYLIDTVPVGCLITRDEEGVQCLSHDCDVSHCESLDGDNVELVFKEDEIGCPRCVNYGDALKDVAGCFTQVGITGCGFEQPLEAMRLALDHEATPENAGFLRDDSILAIVIVTDEDDCSASQPEVLFNPDPDKDSIDSPLGFLHSFRCFEFGVVCDINDRTVTGPRMGCRPRNDEEALLYPISRYLEFLVDLKHPGNTIVMGIMGPVPDKIMVERDQHDRPTLVSSCLIDSDHGADPAIRLKSFVQYFNRSQDMEHWADTSVCDDGFYWALSSFASRLAQKLDDSF